MPYATLKLNPPRGVVRDLLEVVSRSGDPPRRRGRRGFVDNGDVSRPSGTNPRFVERSASRDLRIKIGESASHMLGERFDAAELGPALHGKPKRADGGHGGQP